jgi:hypothetical protein
MGAVMLLCYFIVFCVLHAVRDYEDGAPQGACDHL